MSLQCGALGSEMPSTSLKRILVHAPQRVVLADHANIFTQGHSDGRMRHGAFHRRSHKVLHEGLRGGRKNQFGGDIKPSNVWAHLGNVPWQILGGESREQGQEGWSVQHL